VRTKEVDDIGRSHGLKVLRIPKYFEARWTEFSYILLSSILFSWQAIIKYLQLSELIDSSARQKVTFSPRRTGRTCRSEVIFKDTQFDI